MGRVEILNGNAGQYISKGEVGDFLGLFSDRYERLSGILKRRGDFRSATPIGGLARMRGQVRAIGMVSAKRVTARGHLVIELEDPTGRIPAWIFNGSGELRRRASEILPDEVVGVSGMSREWNSRTSLTVHDLVWPDLPNPGPGKPARADEPACAALVSDPHVGSEQFVEEAFLRFIRWLRGEAGNESQRELAARVKYLVIAGDVVDGIGVYPRQEEELLIHDVYEQYGAAAELLERVPEHISIVVAPGNHDAVRGFEPQPAIPRRVAEGLYDRGCTMVGNPALISLHGVRFLIYHGRSFDDLAASIPGLGMNRPGQLMIKLLQKRHLAPVYGGRVALAPGRRDALVIDEVPDVFATGHTHVFGCERYRNVLAVNSGTFQEPTNYTRLKGIEPTPGRVPVVDLQSLGVRALNFPGGVA